MRTNIDKITGWLLALIMALMVLNVSWQVASRYLFQDPSTFTDELARFLMIWMGFLGAAYITGKRMHPAIDILLKKAAPGKQVIMYKIINALIILFAVSVLLTGGIRLVYITHQLGQTSPSLGLPLSFVYTALPVSGILIVYYSIMNIREFKAYTE